MKQLKAIGALITTGHITSFSEIWDHTYKSVIAKKMGMDYNRFKKLLNNTLLFKLEELNRLAALLGVDGKVLVDLAWAEYVEKKGKKKRT